MTQVLENSYKDANNFSFRHIKKNHVAKVLIFPFILWVLYLYDCLDIVALVHSQIFYGMAVVKRYSKDNNFIQISSFFLVLILGVILLRHKIQGFYNYPIVDQVIISNNAVPFSLWFNKDSIIVGLSLMIAFYKYRVFSVRNIINILYCTLIAISVLIMFAINMDLVKIDIKSINFLKWWLLFAFIAVIVSEAFFRLFLLESIIRLYKGKYSVFCAVIIVSLIFALMHCFYGNIHYMFLAFIASIIYSYTYMVCERRIEASIICHFVVNVIHLLFFTYPFLKVS